MIMSNYCYGKVALLLWVCFIGLTSSENPTPPQITKPIDSDKEMLIYSSEKTNILVQCAGIGEPYPTFEWRKNGISLSETDNIKVFNNGTLLFKNFIESDEGYYQCLAKNSLGTSVSIKVQLIFEKSPARGSGPEGSIQPTVTVSEGEPLSLKCGAIATTKPPYLYKWLYAKDSAALTSGGTGAEFVENSNRKGIDSQGFLRFTFMEADDAGFYRCVLEQADILKGDVSYRYNVFPVQVNPRQASSIRPRLEHGTRFPEANLYTQATLECFFSGKPVPTITWLDNHNQAITGTRIKVTDNGRKLIITSVQAEDEGIFTCTANNGDGSESANLQLNVTTAPQKVLGQGLSNQIKPESQDVTLSCKTEVAKGEQQDAPVWYRNNNLLKLDNLPDPRRYSFSADNSQLFINNLIKSADTACYQCNVSNSVGYAFYDAYLKVITPIQIITRPAEVLKIKDKGWLDLSVTYTGDNCCPITKRWFHKEKVLLDKDLQTLPFVWDQIKDTLSFNASDISEDVLTSRLGEYKCSVSNAYQVVNVTFTIEREEAAEPAVADAGLEIWWIILIVAIAVLLIIIIIIIICIKRNYPRNTYPLEKTELRHNLNPQEELLNQSFQEI